LLGVWVLKRAELRALRRRAAICRKEVIRPSGEELASFRHLNPTRAADMLPVEVRGRIPSSARMAGIASAWVRLQSVAAIAWAPKRGQAKRSRNRSTNLIASSLTLLAMTELSRGLQRPNQV
jgi:hypothetical protein